MSGYESFEELLRRKTQERVKREADAAHAISRAAQQRRAENAAATEKARLLRPELIKASSKLRGSHYSGYIKEFLEKSDFQNPFQSAPRVAVPDNGVSLIYDLFGLREVKKGLFAGKDTYRRYAHVGWSVQYYDQAFNQSRDSAPSRMATLFVPVRNQPLLVTTSDTMDLDKFIEAGKLSWTTTSYDSYNGRTNIYHHEAEADKAINAFIEGIINHLVESPSQHQKMS